MAAVPFEVVPLMSGSLMERESTQTQHYLPSSPIKFLGTTIFNKLLWGQGLVAGALWDDRKILASQRSFFLPHAPADSTFFGGIICSHRLTIRFLYM